MAVNWKLKYETIQAAFLELATGNAGAYEKRKELEEGVKFHMQKHSALLKVVDERDALIKQLRSQRRLAVFIGKQYKNALVSKKRRATKK